MLFKRLHYQLAVSPDLLFRMNKNMEKDEKSEFDFFSWGSFGSFTENKPDTAVYVPPTFAKRRN